MLSISGLWIAQSKFDLGLNRFEFTLTVSPNICRIGEAVPGFSIDILCSENEKVSSPIICGIPSNYLSFKTTTVRYGTTTTSQDSELKSSISVSASRGFSTFSMSWSPISSLEYKLTQFLFPQTASPPQTSLPHLLLPLPQHYQRQPLSPGLAAHKRH